MPAPTPRGRHVRSGRRRDHNLERETELMTDSRKSIIYWAVTIALPCLILLLPVNETITTDLKVFLAVTFTAILCFVFGQVTDHLFYI